MAIELYLVDLEDARVPLGDVPGERAARPERRKAHGALEAILAEKLGPAGRRPLVGRAPSGGLEVDGEPLAISLAHAGRHALIGLSGYGPLGVDLEAPRKLSFTENGRSLITALGGGLMGTNDLDPRADNDVLKAWVAIESVAKATGHGVARLLARVGWNDAREPGRLRAAAEALMRERNLGLKLFDLGDGLRGALAAGRDDVDPQIGVARWPNAATTLA